MAWLQTTGAWTRKAVVVLAFIGIPGLIWWTAGGMIAELGFSANIQWLLTASVLTTMTFGAVSAVLVLKDLSVEP